MSAADVPDTRLPRALMPFAVGRYRLLAGALTLSLFGGGVWLVSVIATVWQLGGTPADLSFVTVGTSVGMVVAVLLGGALADRLPQQRILLVVESIRAAVIVVVVVLVTTGVVQVWHLALAALAMGLAEGMFYPAYSALLPRILHADLLLAANGVEGALRPLAYQAAGPAIAGVVIATASPTAAFWLVAVSQLGAIGCLLGLRSLPRPEGAAVAAAGAAGVLVDIGRGFAYMWRTPWLLWTLLYASIVILLIMGPIEVLLPFAVRDQTGGGTTEFALVLAAFGLGAAVGSIAIASMRMPRRYLTTMNLLWVIGCVPLAAMGFIDSLWLMAAVAFAVGLLTDGAGVLWGTILQRRVPPELLGRVSSLDFFVSLTLMPVSMAIAGPVGEAVGFPVVFLVAGLAPVLFGVAAILIGRMPRDEIEHPLLAGPIGPDDQETLGPSAPIHG